MAVPGFHYNVIEARNQTGDASIPFKLDFGGGEHIRAHVMLVSINHTAQQDSFAAECFIESFTKKGHSVEPVHAYLVANAPGDPTDPPITEIKGRLNVNGCDAVALVVTEYF